jgi:integrase
MSALPAFRVITSEDDLPQSPPPGPGLADLLKRYLREHPAVSPEAARQYGIGVELASRFLRESEQPDRSGSASSGDELFSLARFCDWFKWLTAGRAPATVNGKIDVLWMLWSFASDEGLSANPLPPPRKKPRAREPRKDPVAFTIDQIVQLMAAALRAPPMQRCPWWSTDHWVGFVAVILSTSERFDAMLRCPRSALRDNVFLVPAGLTKDRKERPVVIPEWIAEKIANLPAIGGSDRIWPYPFGTDQLRRRYTDDILVPAGLPHTRWHKFHCLRRSSVTQIYILQGLEKAREQARHFGSGLTLDKYVSQAVVQQQTGSVSFHVPAPTTQLKLF